MPRKVEMNQADIPPNVNIMDAISAKRHERIGRPALASPSTSVPGDITSNITGHITDQAAGNKYDQAVVLPEQSAQASTSQTPAAASSIRAHRLAGIQSIIAEGNEVAVTLKLPVALNEYLNDYVYQANRHRTGKRKLLKQDCVAEALSHWYADHPLPEDDQ